jgi:hypothetical protein
VSVQTPVYLYNQRQLVVLLESNSLSGTSWRFEKVYSKTLTINRGVNNVLEFQFINQNQKPVNITGRAVTCRILNQTGSVILLQKTLTPVFPVTGIAKLELSAGEILDIEPQQCYYSLEISQVAGYVSGVTVLQPGTGYISVPTVSLTGGGGMGATATAVLNSTGGIASIVVASPGAGYIIPPTVTITGGGGSGATAKAVTKDSDNPSAPVFVDDNAGARGIVNIVNSILPGHVPAQTITIPSHIPPTPNDHANGKVYYSSVINTTNADAFTIQALFNEFTGNVQVQGSTLQDFSIYYDIGAPDVLSNSGVLSNVAILNAPAPAGNAVVGQGYGYFTCDINSKLRIANSVTVSGTPADPNVYANIGTNIPYSSPEVYYVTSTNGANTFTLSTENPFTQSTTPTPVSTTPGVTKVPNSNIGLTFTINGFTGARGYQVDGFHPFVRLKITNLGTNQYIEYLDNRSNGGSTTVYYSGDVTDVLSRTTRPPLRP